MKEITILSGKGGTGKTSITAALASVAKNTVFCDNDVDAADLHLIFHPRVKEKNTFPSGRKMSILNEACTACDACITHCRFGAIHRNEQGNLFINSFQCEGCRLCERVCPSAAITSIEEKNNAWFVSDTRFGKLVHARMGPGEENSGRLVTEIRKKARQIATLENARFVINDGPPGIGCATIASLTGTSMVVLVVEPSKPALHDAKRLVELVESFSIQAHAIINKHDIDERTAYEMEKYFRAKKIKILAKIPFNMEMVKSLTEGKTIIEFSPCTEVARLIHKAWLKLTRELSLMDEKKSI